MLNRKCDDNMLEDLYRLISSLETEADCKLLLDDLCTKKELEQMAQRIKAAKLLLLGHTFKQVTEQCEISTATLSRVSRCVQYGEGYNKFLK